ncbi:ASCH domain-containing protein [Pseudanabaena sp. UWO310]|uniref:ASCH domain-containing protein n=1 Tax=Pseudanabaena sp. UWO310 TaxID=2480795 RepID=UPI00115A3131|nr:ASCH domain-containing protein [Pseudanabaena sp. UWO310]TYQ29982.1 ASCH domain-containing protein [Pseudanabaena sp. UWO310]
METHKKALSIRQPWAWLIANGYKDIENRSWSTSFRGEFFIHASKGMTGKEYQQCLDFLDLLRRDATVALPIIHLPDKKSLNFGGIVGAATLTACVTQSDSPWFTGGFGFVLENPRVLPFIPCRGELQFFYPSY